MEVANNPKGAVVGLKAIRSHLQLTQQDLSCKIAEQGRYKAVADYLSRIEVCAQDASMGMLREMAHALCCSVPDLLSVPSEARLAEILIAYRERQLEEARAAAAPAAAGGEA